MLSEKNIFHKTFIKFHTFIIKFNSSDIAIGSIGHFNTIARQTSFSKISQCASNVTDRGDFDVRYSLDLKFTKLDNRYSLLVISN